VASLSTTTCGTHAMERPKRTSRTHRAVTLRQVALPGAPQPRVPSPDAAALTHRSAGATFRSAYPHLAAKRQSMKRQSAKQSLRHRRRSQGRQLVLSGDRLPCVGPFSAVVSPKSGFVYSFSRFPVYRSLPSRREG
jgi:hypothetical protein